MVTLLIFILILGAIIFIHEGGHFLFAKLTGIYVHEFALGMGPKLISHKGKETTYSLRLIPIGGFVSWLVKKEKKKIFQRIELYKVKKLGKDF